jgi:hypothetical protein
VVFYLRRCKIWWGATNVLERLTAYIFRAAYQTARCNNPDENNVEVYFRTKFKNCIFLLPL